MATKPIQGPSTVDVQGPCEEPLHTVHTGHQSLPGDDLNHIIVRSKLLPGVNYLSLIHRGNSVGGGKELGLTLIERVSTCIKTSIKSVILVSKKIHYDKY